MIETLESGGAYKQTKLNTVVDYSIYKIGLDKSDNILSYFSFKKNQ
jgi:hypothetical protein